MAGRVYIQDPTLTIVTFGVVTINGFADGDAVAVTSEGDDETMTKGVDGDIARIKTAGKTRRVVLRLFKGSPANQLLRRVKALATPLVPGGDQFPFEMKDFGEGVVHRSAIAWISKEPMPGVSQDNAVNEWEIVCADMQSTQIIA